MSHINRRYEALDVVSLFSRMKKKEWEVFLYRAYNNRNINKLIAYRYGFQAGLSDAAKKGITTPEIDLWVMKRVRDIEKVAQKVVRLRTPNPADDPLYAKKDPLGYVHKAKIAKKQRDRELERFFQESSF